MGVSNAYVTVNTGASHKRGYTVDNTSHPVGCDVSEKLARTMRWFGLYEINPGRVSLIAGNPPTGGDFQIPHSRNLGPPNKGTFSVL